MTAEDQPPIGSITWRDLTVENAESVRDFYAKLVGWRPEQVTMGDYDDYNMLPPDGGEPVAGICHARGGNADLPPQWLMYITVKDVEASARECEQLGGKVIVAPRSVGDGRFCVIRDPAGAVAALYSG